MVEIKRVLEKRGVPYWQPQMEWGNIKLEADTLPSESKNKHLVFVECRPAWLREGSLGNSKIMIIDHHNELCDRPASLLQVLTLLKVKPTIRQQLVASIDAEFLAKTIEKWPERRKQIIAIWEKGYRKKFDDLKDYRKFKKYCKELFDEAEEEASNGLIIIDQAPKSINMLSAFANLEGVECCIIGGRKDSEDIKPCYYDGRPEVVGKLASLNLLKAHWGKYRLGCRAVPGKFVERVKLLRSSLVQ